VEHRSEVAAPGRASTAVEVRAARADDLPALLAIYNHWVRESVATFDLEPQTLDLWRPWFEEHQHPDRPLLVAERSAAVETQSELLGGAWLSGWRPRPGFALTAESSIYLHPERRTRGVGRALYGALIARARERGLHTLMAVITPPNPASVGLHHSFGYKQIGVTREVGWKFGRWQDSQIWQLMLEGPARG
jgi:L-amino acid N-acyltransferase YncA